MTGEQIVAFFYQLSVKFIIIKLYKIASIEYQIKKEGIFGGGMRSLKFIKNNVVRETETKFAGRTCNIKVPPGLPNTSSISTKPIYYNQLNQIMH